MHTCCLCTSSAKSNFRLKLRLIVNDWCDGRQIVLHHPKALFNVLSSAQREQIARQLLHIFFLGSCATVMDSWRKWGSFTLVWLRQGPISASERPQDRLPAFLLVPALTKPKGETSSMRKLHSNVNGAKQRWMVRNAWVLPSLVT